ncbi:MAG TPA: DUF1501 domain-containing protein [Bryobacteraceae bacterium]|nr:DUF1501 domain-containing protein [Bryobacteraceae bacterium]
MPAGPPAGGAGSSFCRTDFGYQRGAEEPRTFGFDTCHLERRIRTNAVVAGRQRKGPIILNGFSTWMAGDGVKGGRVFGATDEFGVRPAEMRVDARDVDATILRLMGVDHRKPTYLYQGRA